MHRYKIFFIFLIFVLSFSLKFEPSLAEELSFENIESLSGVVLDAKTGTILYAKNPHVQIPPASTVKVLTAMIALDRLPLHQVVRISKNAAETPSVAPFLREGEAYTVEDLLNLMLIKSSNQAAVALAEAVSGSEEDFSALMNAKAQALGLQNSMFRTSSGLPAPNQYSTAYDLAILLYEALKYPKIAEIINTPVKIINNEQGRTIIVKNTNHLLFDELYKDDILGGKTGYTKLSKHCLVNVAKIKDRMVITALLGAPNRESLWQDTKKMLTVAELVLGNKINPVYVNTVINLSKPANYMYSIKKKKDLTKKKGNSSNLAANANHKKNENIATNRKVKSTQKSTLALQKTTTHRSTTFKNKKNNNTVILTKKKVS